MKRAYFKEFFVVTFLSLFLIPFSLGLQMSEVMPDCGNATVNCEFIEFYSLEKVDLQGYVLDTQGQKLKLNGSFQGFFVITKYKSAFLGRFGNLEGSVLEWKGMGLANGGDAITLTYQNQTVDSFSYSSSKKNASWQFLQEWKECVPTPLKENVCQEAPSPSSRTVPEVKNDPVIPKNESKESKAKMEEENSSASSPQLLQEEILLNTTSGSEQKESEEKANDTLKMTGSISEEAIVPDIIHLSGKNINIYKSRNAYISEYAIYGFAVFCILLIILLMIRRN